MKTKKAKYRLIVQEILGIEKSAYYKCYNDPKKQFIIDFLQQFSPYALKAFTKGEKLQKQIFKAENNLLTGYKNFVNTLNSKELYNFKQTLKKSKKYPEFKERIREISPLLCVKILNLDIIYNFEKIYFFKEDILSYIDKYLSLKNTGKKYIGHKISIFIINTLNRLNLDKFKDKQEVIEFIYDEIMLMYHLNTMSINSREEEFHFFRQEGLLKEIESILKRAKPTFFDNEK
jgi:hypothetical protein